MTKKGSYEPAIPYVWATGSKYGSLQTDGFDYLCPDCGGYGYNCNIDPKCGFCKGIGVITLTDSRIVNTKPVIVYERN